MSIERRKTPRKSDGGPRVPRARWPIRPAHPAIVARRIGLFVVAFGATLGVLLGLRAIVLGGGDGSPRSPGPVAASQSASPADSSVAPSSAPLGDPVLVGAGDIADCTLPGDEQTASLLDAIPGTVFTAGDNAYPDGTSQQFGECYAPTWGRHRARTLPAAGNHDWTTEDAAGYRSYFGDAVGEGGATWYSTDLGRWHVVVLDSNCARVDGCGPDSEQGRWLAEDLADSDARCTLAIWHHPRFSSGEHGSDPVTDPFWRALAAEGADVIVNGHDHDYERFAPQDPDGREDRARGIRQFVAGTGGAVLRAFTTVAANSELRLSVTHGVLKLTLHPTSYDWEFVPVGDATVTDSGSAFCH